MERVIVGVTFGITRSQNLNTHVIVVAKDGPPIVLSANVLLQITEAVQCGLLLQSELDFLHTISHENLADSVPEREVHLLLTF